jgi:hypothetical protein
VNTSYLKDPVYMFSVKYIFIGAIASTVIGNQLWMLGPFYVGQIISWFNDACAAAIVIMAFRYKLWTFMLVFIIIAAKITSIATGGAASNIVYLIFLNVLYCITGAIIAIRHYDIIYKQLLFICFINVIFMFLQVAGVGEWTQFLTTHGDKLAEQVETLFVTSNQPSYSYIQSRPAGLLHSNIVLSLIVLFALALHLGRQYGRFAAGTYILCAMAVLSMAKIVFFGMIVMTVVMMITGNRLQRISVFKAAAVFIFMLCLYALLFPSVFHNIIRFEVFRYSFFIRLNDIISIARDRGVMWDAMEQALAGTPSATWLEEGEHISGYSYFITMLPYVIASLPFLTFFFIFGYRKMCGRYPQLSNTTILTFLVILFYPFIFPVWRAQIYWFMAGFALLPLFVQFMPRYFNGSFLASLDFKKNITRFTEVH